MNAEDDLYYRTETARVLAELVRPLPCDSTARGRDQLLWVCLLRCVQTHLYVHSCTALYCLHKRATCRVFFPWPYQSHQCVDCNPERVAMMRRLRGRARACQVAA